MTEPRKRSPYQIGPQINVAFPPDMIIRMNRASAAANISRAEWIRRACSIYLDTTDKGTDS